MPAGWVQAGLHIGAEAGGGGGVWNEGGEGAVLMMD